MPVEHKEYESLPLQHDCVEESYDCVPQHDKPLGSETIPLQHV